MRKLRRRRNKKQVHIVLALAICLISIMTVGYAAFSTNISLTAKGNIKEKRFTINDLKEKIVTEGDGLYKDMTEENRYIYRGASPDNYIKLDNDIYRIISIESDGTIKIMRNESIGNKEYDKVNSRYSSSGYCNSNIDGCSLWGSKTTMLDINGDNITKMPREVGGTSYELPNEEADLNIYLNETWYNTLNEQAKAIIDKNHTWNIGLLNFQSGQTLETDLQQERAYKWKGNIGLINATDYIKASINANCTSTYEYRNTPECYNSSETHNWIFNNDYQWSLTARSYQDSNRQWYFDISGPLYSGNVGLYSYNVRPSLFLKSDIQLTGQGTETDPYEIVS